MMKDYDEEVPIQYQEKRSVFMGMELMVDGRVLIPRPETEILVSTACGLLKEKEITDPKVADIGTGSGAAALGVASLFADGKVVAADISPDALDVARFNVAKFGLAVRIELRVSDMFSAFTEEEEGTFDAVISNPPYVSEKDYGKLDAWVLAEPKQALYGGRDGMKILRRIAQESGKMLRPGGFTAVEVGYDQAGRMKEEFRINGFINVDGFQDENGYERVIIGWKIG
ncbi:MAG: peptide chain release factor N(5)-glutamine methyltransferase [Candidatus Omnitrophota bacterium]